MHGLIYDKDLAGSLPEVWFLPDAGEVTADTEGCLSKDLDASVLMEHLLNNISSNTC